MIEEGKFGVQESVCLTTTAISAKIFLTSPAYLTNFVGTAGWQMTTISCLTSMLAFAFIYLLLKRFPNTDVVAIFNSSLGPFVGFIFSITFLAAFLQSASTLLREYTDVIKVYVYPDTPMSIILGTFTVAVIIASYLGLESIARISKLTAYIMASAYALLLLLAMKNYNITNLFPISGYGIDRTIIHGLKRSSAYDEVLILSVFAGSLQGAKYVKKAGFISLILSGIIIGGGLLCFNLAFPYQSTQELTAPIYVLARGIKQGTFFQRLDPIFIFLWNFASFIAVSILFYCAVSIYCKMFKINDKRPVIFPMAVLLFTFAAMPKDFSSVIEGSVQTLREYGWSIFYVLPLITLIVSAIRKKKGETNGA
ncbi:MAG TPA: endospore germination permease [Ruminiclostridium sp.]|nr:endospore germination permease [Ruminiclostridium sp.]